MSILLQDTFDDNVFDATKWSRTDNTDVSEQNNRIEIHSTATNHCRSLNTFDFTNQIAMCQMGTINPTSDTWMEFNLADSNSFANFYQFAIQPSTNSLTWNKSVSNTFTQLGTTTYNSTNHVYFRFRIASGTIYFEVAAATGGWTTLGSEALSIPVTALYYYFRNRTVSGTPTTHFFDNAFIGDQPIIEVFTSEGDSTAQVLITYIAFSANPNQGGLAYYPHQRSYDGSPLNAATSQIVRFRAMRTGLIVNIYLWVSQVTGSGTSYYNIYLNGVPLFTGANRLAVSAGSSNPFKENLSIAVNRGDVITLELEEFAAGQVHSAPISLLVETS